LNPIIYFKVYISRSTVLHNVFCNSIYKCAFYEKELFPKEFNFALTPPIPLGELYLEKSFNCYKLRIKNKNSWRVRGRPAPGVTEKPRYSLQHCYYEEKDQKVSIRAVYGEYYSKN